jgi:hypothetical protein
MEMLDHVASAVEKKMEAEDLIFYDAFKDYMIENKKELLKNNREGFSFWDKKSFKEGSNFLMKPLSIITFPLVMLFVYLLIDWIEKDTMHYFYYGFIFFIAIVWIAGLFVYRELYLKGKRFFVLEQSGILFFFIFQIMNPFLMNQKVLDESGFWMYGLFFYFFLNALAFQIYNLKLHQKKLLKMVS